MDDEMDGNCGHCGTRDSLESVEQVHVAQWTLYAEGYGEMAYAKFVAVSRCRACEKARDRLQPAGSHWEISTRRSNI
jgi:hypothetical protein